MREKYLDEEFLITDIPLVNGNKWLTYGERGDDVVDEVTPEQAEGFMKAYSRLLHYAYRVAELAPDAAYQALVEARDNRSKEGS